MHQIIIFQLLDNCCTKMKYERFKFNYTDVYGCVQGWVLTRSPSSGVSTTPTAASPRTRGMGRRRRRGAATSQHQTAGPGPDRHLHIMSHVIGAIHILRKQILGSPNTLGGVVST